VEPNAACARLIEALRGGADPANVKGMARFGISTAGTLGVSMVDVRALGREALREHRRDDVWRHALAACLWESGIHEARILATIVEDPDSFTPAQALAWARAVDSWDVCDQLCMNLLRRTGFAWELIAEWTGRDEEFVKRAGFVLIATLAVHAKAEPDSRFSGLLLLIPDGAADERPMVHKAVNWALRQIGKRGGDLHGQALAVAHDLAESEVRSVRWVGRDAMRELCERG
jgi:3-methyladenine DNA glycosylase AlkD